MKKTLNEEKNRILSLIKEFHGTGYPRGESEYKPEPIDNEKELEDILRKCVDSGKSIEEVEQKVHEILVDINAELPPDEEKPELPMYDTSKTMTGGIPRGIGAMEEQDEYETKYDKNMSQGFAINEGNAFVGAAKKARKEGKDKFELDGKTYKVTLKK